MDDIQFLKEQEKQANVPAERVVVPTPAGRPSAPPRPRRRQRPNLFGPLLLIGAGVYFLLRNLGIVVNVQLNWWVFAQVWPLLLIFGGLNIIFGQSEGFFGRMIGGLIQLSGLVIFGGLLLFGHQLPWIQDYGPNQDIKVEAVNLALADNSPAAVEIHFTSAGAMVQALEDSRQLMAGTISYIGSLEIAQTGNDLHLEIGNNWWPTAGTLQPWDLGLNGTIPMELTLHLGSGESQLDLAALQLENLVVDGASGTAELHLPTGTYDVSYDVGSGQTAIYLPSQGQQNIQLDGGSGNLTIYLPATAMAQINVTSGSGTLSLPNQLQLVGGDVDEDGLWQTADYNEDAPNRIQINLDIASGNVLIREADPLTGR